MTVVHTILKKVLDRTHFARIRARPPRALYNSAWALLWLLGTWATIPSVAESEVLYQSHASIRDAARAFILNEYADQDPNVEVGRLDARLRLSRCTTALETFAPAGNRRLGNTTVGIRCNGSKPWTLYVAVKVQLFESVVVAARPLTRSSIIGPQDVKLERRDLGRLVYGYLTRLDHAIGQSVRRPIAADKAIRPGQIEPQQLVRRGQRVTILAKSGGLEVRMAGKALMDGAAGQRIRIKNTVSKRVVEAVVLAANTVRVTL